VHFKTNWTDGTVSIQNVTDDFVTFTDRMFITDDFNYSYADPGTYEVLATAYNLHSDEEYGAVKYTHNATQVIHVQKAVEEWQHEVVSPHMRDDGAFFFDWLYDAPDASSEERRTATMLPTNPFMNCWWGDQTVLPQDAPVNFTGTVEPYPTNAARVRYRVAYDYGAHGEYNVSCKMYNQVSYQHLVEDLVVIFDKIMNFTVQPMYIPEGSLDKEMPLGEDMNQLPIHRNVTFTFDYSQGQ